MADGGLQHQAQGYDLVVESAASRRLVRRWLTPGGLGAPTAADRGRGRPVDPVFLDLTGGDLGNPQLAEEWQQMKAQRKRSPVAVFGFVLGLNLPSTEKLGDPLITGEDSICDSKGRSCCRSANDLISFQGHADERALSYRPRARVDYH